ncbi:MAG TPA: hypothetical protein VFG69_00185 [Nannocystaceae bacterium]|nr:hypothetical protein [Nannocystaceae bacterium]
MLAHGSILAALLALRGAAPLEDPPAESASDPSVVVDASRCAAIDPDDVQRLLALELDAVTQEIRVGPPLRVELACTGATLTIAVSDPLTGKQLQRDVPMPAPDQGRERVIALAIAQLFAASWLELLLPSEPEPDVPAPTPERGTSPAAVRAARDVAQTRVRRPERRLELAIGASGRAHALEATPWGTGAGDVEVRGWFGPVAVLGRITALGGAAQRDLGRVRAVAVLGGLGLGFRVPARGRWRFGGSLVMSVGWARIRGVSDRAGVQTAVAQSATGCVALGVGPRVVLGRLVLELDADVGGMLRPPEGIVANGPSVTLGGLVAGGTFRVAVDLLGRRSGA